jgi:hypothetical protein
MNRRTVLAGVCVGLTGCLGQNLGQATLPQTTPSEHSTTTSATPFTTQVENTHMTFEIVDYQMPAPDGVVSQDFNCEASTVTLNGWLRPPNGCHHIQFDSYKYTAETATATINFESQTDPNESTDGTTCEGIKVKYRIVLEVDGELPQTIQIKYRPSDSKYEQTFTTTHHSCS